MCLGPHGEQKTDSACFPVTCGAQGFSEDKSLGSVFQNIRIKHVTL